MWRFLSEVLSCNELCVVEDDPGSIRLGQTLLVWSQQQSSRLMTLIKDWSRHHVKFISSSDCSSSGRPDNMPVHLLSDGAGPPRQVPAHLTRIPISVIDAGVDCTNRTVQVWRGAV